MFGDDSQGIYCLRDHTSLDKENINKLCKYLCISMLINKGFLLFTQSGRIEKLPRFGIRQVVINNYLA